MSRRREPGRRYLGIVLCDLHDWRHTDPSKPPPPLEIRSAMCPGCRAEREEQERDAADPKTDRLRTPQRLEDELWAKREPQAGKVDPGSRLEREAIEYMDARARARNGRRRVMSHKIENGRIVPILARKRKPRPFAPWRSRTSARPEPDLSGPIEVEA
jgi:hypothetical protein